MPPGGYYSQPQPAAQQLPPDNGVVYDPATDTFIQQTAPDPTQAPPPPMDPGLLQTAGGYGGMPPAPPPPTGPTMGPMGQYNAGPIQGTDLPAAVDPYAGGYGQGGYLQSAGGYGGMPAVDPAYGLDKSGGVAPPPQYDPQYGSAPVIRPTPSFDPMAVSPPAGNDRYIPLQQNPGLAPGQSIYPPQPDATGYRTPGGDPTQALRYPSTFPAMANPGGVTQGVPAPSLGQIGQVGINALAAMGSLGINALGGGGQMGAQALIGQPYQAVNLPIQTGPMVPARFQPHAPVAPPVNPNDAFGLTGGSILPPAAPRPAPYGYANALSTGAVGAPIRPGAPIPAEQTFPLTPTDWIQSVDQAVPPLQWLDDRLHQIQAATDQVAHGGNGGIVNRNGTILSTQQANQPIFPQLVPNMNNAVPALQTVDNLLGTGPGGGFGADPNAIASLLGPTTPSGATPARPALPRSSFPAGSAIPAEADPSRNGVYSDQTAVSAQVKMPDGSTQNVSVKNADGTTSQASILVNAKTGEPILDGNGKKIIYAVKGADGVAQSYADWLAKNGGDPTSGTTTTTSGDQVIGGDGSGTVVAGGDSGGSSGGSSGGGYTKKSYGGSSSHSYGGSGSSSHKSSGSYRDGGSYHSGRDGIYHITKSDGSRVTIDLNNLPDEVKNNDAFMSLLKKDPSAAAKLLADHGYGTTRGTGRGARARRKGLGANGLPVVSTSTTSTNGRSGPLANAIFDRYFEIANKPIPPDVAKAVVEALPVTSAGGASAGKRSASTGNKKK